MGHLVDYEEARGDLEKALAALIVAEAKNAKARAWNWAEKAAMHAEGVGVENAQDLLGSGRYPETEPLRNALEGTMQENTVELAAREQEQRETWPEHYE